MKMANCTNQECLKKRYVKPPRIKIEAIMQSSIYVVSTCSLGMLPVKAPISSLSAKREQKIVNMYSSFKTIKIIFLSLMLTNKHLLTKKILA